MNAILSALLENTILFTLLFGGIWLIKQLFKKQLSAAMHYLLWGIVILKLLIPVGLPSEISPLNLFSQAQTPAIVLTGQNPIIPHDIQDTSNVTNIPTMAPATQADGVQNVQNQETGSTPIQPRKNMIDWTTIILTVWVTGAVGMLAWLGACALRIRKKITASSHRPPIWMQELFQTCKIELGIKRDIQMVMQNRLPVPAITGMFKPVLILPATLEREKSEAKLRHIYLHELAHYKRGDIAATLILNILNALYWWNPLVWVAVRLINKDMETACDATVLKSLGRKRRQEYIQTIVEFAGKSNSKQLQTALCMNDGRIKMKKRIKGMFLRTKTKIPVKIGVLLLAGMVAIACFTTACQPTPTTPAVINKNTDLVGEVTKANEQGNQAELAKDKQAISEQIKKISGHLVMEYKPNKQVTIKVDADVLSPGDIKIPVVRVKPENFSKEQFEAFTKYLTNGQPLYSQGEYNSLTKEEITALTTRAKAMASNKDLSPDIKKNLDDMAKYYQSQYANAKSKADEKPYDGEMRQAKDNSVYSSITRLKCYAGKDEAATLELWQSHKKTTNQMVFYNQDLSCIYTVSEPYTGIDAKNIKMTYQEAKTKAEDFVRHIDGENSNMSLCDSSIEYQIGRFTSYTKETSPNAYTFKFARIYKGVVVKPIMYLEGNDPKVDYTKQVRPESISISMDDSGVLVAGWQNYTQHIEDVSEDTPLKDFDSVKDIFTQYCKEKFTWVPQDDSLPKDPHVTLNIKKIELNLMITPEKDNLDNYITIPVWDFIGDVDYDKEYITQEGSPAYEQKNISILTINAINGSIIDRKQGY